MALSGILQMILGRGQVPTPPGNMGNAPAGAPVQEQVLNTIQLQMFGHTEITQIGSVPVPFQNWAGQPLNVQGITGTIGGGVGTDVPTVDGEPLLTYNPATGQFFNLNKGVR